MLNRPGPSHRPATLVALAALLAMLTLGIVGIASTLAQDEEIQDQVERSDWRLVQLVHDGSLVDVGEIGTLGASASPVPVADPSGSPQPSSAPAAAVLGVPTLSVHDDQRAGGWTGCNAWNATYELDGDAVTLGPIAATRAACPEPAGSLEAAYLDDLALVASWAIGADPDDPNGELLTLSDASGAPVLVFVPLPASPVLGSWQVIAYRDASGASVPSLADAPPTATFGADGRVTGSTGCNSYSADYVVDGQAMAVGPIVTTLEACPDFLAAQEQDFLAGPELIDSGFAAQRHHAAADRLIGLDDAHPRVASSGREPVAGAQPGAYRESHADPVAHADASAHPRQGAGARTARPVRGRRDHDAERRRSPRG